MSVPIFLLHLAANLFVAVADCVPKLDVTPSCRGAMAAKVLTQNVDAMQSCLDSEKKAHDQLAKEWLEFTPADRAKCVNAIMIFLPTYTELLTCLEFSKELKKHQ
jgi:hypothetical protein